MEGMQAIQPAATDSIQETGPEIAPPLGQWQRVGNAYVDPEKTFRDIQRNASWWLPFVLGILVSLFFAASIDHKVGFQQVVQTEVARNVDLKQKIDAVPADRRPKAMHDLTVSTRISSYAYPLTGLVMALVGAGLLTISFHIGLKARKASYRQFLAVWFYAGLPLLLKSVLAAALLLAGAKAAAFDLHNPVGTNIGWYLGPGAPEWLRTILSSADIFTIWTVVLLVLGCSAISGVRRRNAAAIVVGWWLLAVFVSAASAAVNR
jgi:hypothetical protein